ncbi:hypothetical protein MARVELLAND_42 [Bacillus phage vB_BspM_MarvelLand]|nr:hypothetical protein MARVELLAND_42 [Bacillus phage vB_BspM_MarvelLand]
MGDMASGSKTKTCSTYLQCTECTNVVKIYRKKSRLKEKDHVKHMYCYKCKVITAHLEVKEDVFIPSWIDEWQRSVRGEDTDDN